MTKSVLNHLHGEDGGLVSERDWSGGLTLGHMLRASCCSGAGGPFQAVNCGAFSVGGCVVPPGTAAMCRQVAERGRKRATERGKRVERQGCRWKTKMAKGRKN